MANIAYASTPIVGVALTRADTSASPAFPPGTVVVVQGTSVGTGNLRHAMYAKVLASVNPSTGVMRKGTDGTVSVSASGWVTMNAATTAPGDWVWVRTSATLGG